MSAKTSRPRVQSVNSATTSQSGLSGAILAAIAVASTIKLLGAATRKTLQSVTPALPQDALKTIQPPAEVRQAQQRIQQTVPAQTALPAVEAAKVAALVPLAASTYRITNEAQLKQHLTSLCQAASVTDVQRITGQLTALIEAEHHKVLVNSLRVACTNAAIKTGFTTIESMPGTVGTIRLVATNPSGQSLVTEISSDKDGNTSLETEVVGVNDGSCNTLLDAFDKALGNEGVRSAPPKRSFTGGICELAAAREFVRNKVVRQTPQSVQTVTGLPDEAARRSQRLNRSQTVRQRK